MKLKKYAAKIAMCVAAVIVFGCMSGCISGCRYSGGKNVTLSYILPGDVDEKYANIVWTEFNKELSKKLPGVSVNFKVIPKHFYAERLAGMLAENKQTDIISNNSLDMQLCIENGYFLPLNVLLDKFGTETKAILPHDIWDYQRYGKKIYGVPSYSLMAKTKCLCFNKEYSDKYLDKNALRTALNTSDIIDEKVYDVLEQYMQNLKNNGVDFKTAIPIDYKGYDMIYGCYGVRIIDAESKVVNINESQQAKIRHQTMREWSKKGYVNAVILNSGIYIRGELGEIPFWTEDYTNISEEQLSEKYGCPIECIPYEIMPIMKNESYCGGTSISLKSRYPEESMKLINLIQTDKKLYNILVYGVEGRTYSKKPNGNISLYTKDSPNIPFYYIDREVVGNASLAYPSTDYPEELINWIFNIENNTTIQSRIIGFMPDVSEFEENIQKIKLTQKSFEFKTYWRIDADSGDLFDEHIRNLNSTPNKKIAKKIQYQLDKFIQSKLNLNRE